MLFDLIVLVLIYLGLIPYEIVCRLLRPNSVASTVVLGFIIAAGIEHFDTGPIEALFIAFWGLRLLLGDAI